MVAPVIYFAGGEDSDFSGTGNVSVDTTSGHYRSAYARCGLQADDGDSLWDTGNVMSVADAWFHARVWMTGKNMNNLSFGSVVEYAPIRIVDATGVARLIIYMPTLVGSPTTTAARWRFAKVNAAGTVTAIGSVFNAIFTGSPDLPDALDIQIIDYASGGAGEVNVWINKVLAYSTSAATLATDSNTTINGLYLCGLGEATSASGRASFSYSEVIISDSDTRGMTLDKLTPDADGNTDSFDEGGVSNINEITLDDATLNASGTAGQVQQYTIDALPAGNYGVVSLVFSARSLAGSSGGPTKIDFGVRTGAADYWGSDVVLPAAIDRVQDMWAVNPATGNAFTIGELAAAGFNVGMKSVA